MANPEKHTSRPLDRPAEETERRHAPEAAGKEAAPDRESPVALEKRLEEHEAQERASPSGRILYKAILSEGEEELDRPSSALFWSGVAAGLSMGFSLVAQGLLQARLPDAGWRPLVTSFGYSVGFIIVILGRQQLFTENTLTPILPLLNKPSFHTALNVLRLWAVVLLGNVLGAVLIGWALARTGVFDPAAHAAFINLGHEAMQHGFAVVLIRGIFAGWLIALIVWLLPFAEAARFWVILLITYVVGLGQFSHVVAGAVEVFCLAWAGEKSWAAAWGLYFLPALIGNIIGGITLVAALNHAQVVSGRGEDKEM